MTGDTVDDWRERYAASTTLYQWGSFEQALERLGAQGFRWIEIADDFGDPRREPDVLSGKLALARLGLRAHSLHLPIAGMMIGHPDPESRRAALATLLAGLELAAEFGAGLAVLHVNTDVERLPVELFDQCMAVSIELVGRLADRAGELGLVLALENLPRGRRQDRRFGSSLQELCTDFSGPRFGFCLDTGHALANGCDLADETRAAGPRLVSIHLSDNDGSGDLHWPPGQGLLDWRGLEAALAGVEYRGRIVLELLRNRTGGSPDEVLQQALAFVRRAAG